MLTDDKRSTLALMLIFILVITYMQWMFPPSASKPVPAVPAAPSQLAADAPSTVPLGTSPTSLPASSSVPASTQIANIPAPQEIRKARLALPTLAEIQAAPKTIIKTTLFEATLTHLGARLSSFEAKNFKAQLAGDARYQMVHTSEGSPLPLGVETSSWTDAQFNYTLEQITGDVGKEADVLTLQPGGTLTLTFVANLTDGQKAIKVITVRDDSYLVDVKANFSGAAKDVNQFLWLSWNHYAPPAELTVRIDPYQYTYVDETDRLQHVAPSSLAIDSGSKATPVSGKWVAFGDKYFMAALVPDAVQQSLKTSRTGDVYSESARGDAQNVHARIYIGPKDYQILQATNLQLERSIDLGFFSFLASPIMQALRYLHEFLGNWGLSIIVLTLAIKTCFYPLTKASLYSMRGMQEIAPEMKDLRERIKDPTQLNQEIMALYKRKGVNPMGGCLPIAIQIPVFFSLYSALQHAIELRHAPFALWVNDLSTPEHLDLVGFNTPLMIMLMGAIMFYQQYSTPTPGMDPSQRKMMLGVSLMFTLMFFIFPFPAGLALYMLVNTTISLVQQRAIKSERFPNPFRVTMLANVAIFSIAFLLTRLG